MLCRSAVITLLTSTLFAQSSLQDPKSPQTPTTTLKANTQLVIVDVTVTDSHPSPFIA